MGLQHLSRGCAESLVAPRDSSGDVYKAQKPAIELVIADGHTAKDFHALEVVFSQMACLVAIFIQEARLLVIALAREDDLPENL